MEKKIIRNYSIFMIMEGLAVSFFFATGQLFLVSKGLSLFEINILNAGFMLANFLFEVPTGALADFFGRKKAVVIGLWFYVLAFAMYFFSNFFWQFLLAEMLAAIAYTSISGSLEALVVDSLHRHNYSGDLSKVFRRRELSQFGVLIGVIAGSLIAQIDLSLPWLLSALGFAVLAITFNFLFKDEDFNLKDKISFNFDPVKDIMRDSLKYGLKNRKFMLIVIFASTLSFSMQPINMYWPIVLQEYFDLDVKYMGFVFAAVVVSAYMGAQLSILWQRKIKCPKNAIFFSQIITVFGVILCVLSSGLSFFVFFFLLHEFGRGLFNPLSRSYINNSIVSKNRSTVLSLESMIVKLGSTLGLISSGIIAENFGILSSWFVSAIFLTLSILFFWMTNKKA